MFSCFGHQQTQKKGIWKRLNHLMSVFNDAWRYLDLCFMPASLRVLNIFLGNNKLSEEWKAKAEKRVKTRISIVFELFFLPPNRARLNSLFLFNDFHYFLSLLQTADWKLITLRVESAAINQILHLNSFFSILVRFFYLNGSILFFKFSFVS